MQFFHLLGHVWRIQVDIAKGNNLARIFLCRLGNYFAIRNGVNMHPVTFSWSDMRRKSSRYWGLAESK